MRYLSIRDTARLAEATQIIAGEVVRWEVLGRGGACLSNDRVRTTLSYMKSATVTIRLDAKLERELNRLSRQLGRSRSELVRAASAPI